MMYDFLLQSADNMVQTYVFGAWNTFNAVANPWITGMFALYVVIMGYLVWLGRVNATFSDLGPRIFKVGIIYVLVTNVGLLTMIVYNTFVEIPPSVVNMIYTGLGDNTSGIDQSMQEIYDAGILAAEQISKSAGYNVILHLYAALIAGLTIVIVMLAAGYIVLSKLAIAVLLSLAPFFIALYLFAGTKSLFEGWLRQTMTFALIPILVYSLLIMIVSFMGQATDTIVATTENQVVKLGNIAAYTAISGVSLLLLKQVMAWAAGIAGGFQLSSMGAENAAASGAGKSAKAGKKGAGKYLENRKARLQGSI